MKEDKILLEELNSKTEAAFKAAESFCEALAALDQIDPGEPTEEEKEKCAAFLQAAQMRKQTVLKSVLANYSWLLFI